MASLSFKDVLVKITDASRLCRGDFIWREMGHRSIQQVLMTLAVARLHEIPVFIDNNEGYHVFGLWDILPSIVDLISTRNFSPPSSPPSEALMLSYKNSFHRQLRSTISEVITERPSSHSFVSMDVSSTLYQVVATLLENNFTQISILADSNILQNVISMEQILLFLYVNRMRMHTWYFTLTVKDLNLGGNEPLCTILNTDPVFHAFRLMHEKQVACVAVVNAKRQVVGCINLSDLQVIFKPKRSVADLFISASKFIELGLQLSKGIVPAPYAACATCTQETTLGELLHHAVRNRSYNFFLVDSNQIPVRLITPRDIITAFFNTESPYQHTSKCTPYLPSIGCPNFAYTRFV